MNEIYNAVEDEKIDSGLKSEKFIEDSFLPDVNKFENLLESIPPEYFELNKEALEESESQEDIDNMIGSLSLSYNLYKKRPAESENEERWNEGKNKIEAVVSNLKKLYPERNFPDSIKAI